MKKSKPFNDLSSPIRKGLDDLSEADLERLRQIPSEQLEKMRDFVIVNQDLLRRVGGSAREMQWFRDVLEWISASKNENSKQAEYELTKHVIFVSPDTARTFALHSNLSYLDLSRHLGRHSDLATVLDTLRANPPSAVYAQIDHQLWPHLHSVAVEVRPGGGGNSGWITIGESPRNYDAESEDDFYDVVKGELVQMTVLVPTSSTSPNRNDRFSH